MTLGGFYPKSWNIMSVVFQYLWIIPFCMGSFITIVQTGEEKVITWNRSNTMFQSGGASMSIAVGSNLVVKCPNNATNPEYYKVYWVPSSAFTNCFISNSDWNKTELLVNCNNPNRTTPLTFVTEITEFTGVPFAKDFVIGTNYYLATFSTGTYNGLGNTYEGACLDYNMKLNLTITDAPTASTQAPTNTTSTSTQSTTTSTTQSSSSSSSQQTTSTSQSTTILTSTTFSTTTSDIPDSTDIVITVPGGGNTGIIDASSARTLCPSWILVVLSLSLSLYMYVGSVGRGVNSKHIACNALR